MICIRCLRSPPHISLIFLATRTFASASLLYAGETPTKSSPTSTSPAEPYLVPGPPRPAGASDKSLLKSGTPAGTVLKNINFHKNKRDPVALDDSEYPDWLWTLLDQRAATSASVGPAGDAYSKSKKERALAKKRSEKLARIEARNTETHIPIHEQTVDLPFATVPDPSANSLTVPPETPFTRVVSAIAGVGQSLSGQLPPGAKPGSKSSRPSTVEIGRDVQVTPLEAHNARMAIRKALRKKQRKEILERNFLSTLRN